MAPQSLTTTDPLPRATSSPQLWRPPADGAGGMAAAAEAPPAEGAGGMAAAEEAPAAEGVGDAAGAEEAPAAEGAGSSAAAAEAPPAQGAGGTAAVAEASAAEGASGSAAAEEASAAEVASGSAAAAEAPVHYRLRVVRTGSRWMMSKPLRCCILAYTVLAARALRAEHAMVFEALTALHFQQMLDSHYVLHPLSGLLNPVWQVGHSLEGASLLIYAVFWALQRRANRIHCMILLTPAGFLKTNPIPWVSTAPVVVPLLSLQRHDICCAPS